MHVLKMCGLQQLNMFFLGGTGGAWSHLSRERFHSDPPTRAQLSPIPGWLRLALHLVEAQHSAEGSSARFARASEALQQQSCRGQ